MKYERVTKVKRNEELRVYVKRHPELSHAEVAANFGISRQRVSKLLKKGG